MIGAPFDDGCSQITVTDLPSAPALADSEPTFSGAVGSVRTSWSSLAFRASVEWYDLSSISDTAATWIEYSVYALSDVIVSSRVGASTFFVCFTTPACFTTTS